jgi:hypothetical protein
MSHTLGRLGRIPDVEHQTLHEVLLMAEEGWQLYPIYSVAADNVCLSEGSDLPSSRQTSDDAPRIQRRVLRPRAHCGAVCPLARR